MINGLNIDGKREKNMTENNCLPTDGKKFFLIIPVFNEKKTIGEIIRRADAALAPDYQKEIIVVDDGSADGTEEILENLKGKFSFTLIKHRENSGKGAAIKTALKHLTDGVALIQDADLEYDPADYRVLLENFNPIQTPVVYGSRNLLARQKGNFFYLWGGKFLTALFNFLYGTRLTDLNTGYKLFRTDILQKANLESDGFEFCEEITAKAARSGYPIKEVPVHYQPRKFSAGKKINVWDGLVGIWAILKYRWKK